MTSSELNISPQSTLEEKAKEYKVNLLDQKFADFMDDNDDLKDFRNQFHIPKIAELYNCTSKSTDDCTYLCGNSLGLQPVETEILVQEELDKWKKRGVQGHFDDSERPWVSIGEHVRDDMATIVGGKSSEVVVMNSLTVNLHLMMTSFYRPEGKRTKILLEAKAFPSDNYAVKSQLDLHGLDVSHMIEVEDGDDVIAAINANADKIALVLLPGVQYYTGRAFDIQTITEAAHKAGCKIGWDLAHAVGNIILKLNEWNVDFACWCTYKYLNSGPGCIGGAFVHEAHHQANLKRMLGWWGHKLETRFTMANEWEPAPDALVYQLSNPPVLECVKLRASLNLFKKATMEKLRAKSELLTSYLECLLNAKIPKDKLTIITPKDYKRRGCQLSLVFSIDVGDSFNYLESKGIVCDIRKPNCIRIAPTPMYNTFSDVYTFVHLLEQKVC